MKKQNSWWAWIIIIALVIGGWYWWKNYYQPMTPAAGGLTANPTTSGGSGFPSLGIGGNLHSVVAGILQDGTAEKNIASAASGESDLVKSISKGIGDLNQFYDENSY